MSNEPALRAALREYAGHAPGSGGLLEAVRARSHRRRRRRQLAAAAGVAVVVAVAGPVVAVRATTAGPGPQGEPDARQPATRTELTEPAADTELVEPYNLEIPDFPFTPGWVPPEAVSTRYEHAEFGLMKLSHLGPDGQAVISVQVYPADPDHLLRSMNKLMDVHAGTNGQQSQRAVTVQGRDAVLMTATSSELEDADEPQPPTTVVAVSWLHETGLRVAVAGPVPEGDVLRYAEDLQREPYPTQLPFTFDAMPPGARLGSVGASSMMFRPTGPSGDDFVSVRLLSRGTDPADLCRQDRGYPDEPWPDGCLLPPEQVQVGGYEAQRYGADMLVVNLPDGTLLRLAAAGSLALSPDDLVRFAAGVHVTEHAVPAS